MKAYDNGSLFSVSVSADDVDSFKEQWPCNGMPSRPIWFQFDKRNGDLVDMRPSNWEEQGADGSAMLALSQDAQNYGIKRLKLNLPLR